MLQGFKNPASVPPNFGLDKPIGSILVVVSGYAADTARIGEGSTLLRIAGTAWMSLTTRNYRNHVRQNRDYYANPRTPHYMLSVIGEVLQASTSGSKVTLLHDARVAIDQAPAWCEHIEAAALTESSKATLEQRITALSRAADVVLLAHEDPLGLGKSAIEASLTDRFQHIFVVNGRKRVYRLDRHAEKMLATRRFLAMTRLVELGLALYLPLRIAFERLAQRRT